MEEGDIGQTTPYQELSNVQYQPTLYGFNLALRLSAGLFLKLVLGAVQVQNSLFFTNPSRMQWIKTNFSSLRQYC